MNNAIKTRAVNARPSCARGRFDAKNQADNLKNYCMALKRCATVLSGAQNTTDNAVDLPESEVFSRPEFKFLGVGIAYPQGRQHGVIHVLNPHIQSRRLKSALIGFQSHNGAKAMTTVNTTTTPKAAPLGITPATFPGSVERQIAIETALADALHYIRLPYSARTLKAATARTRRAASMLKQACTESTNGRA